MCADIICDTDDHMGLLPYLSGSILDISDMSVIPSQKPRRFNRPIPGLENEKKKKESDFCLMEREMKKINFQNSIQKDRYKNVLRRILNHHGGCSKYTAGLEL
jgi:hypothetical protein